MILAKKKECTACMVCVDACAHNVLRSEVDDDGYFTIRISSEKDCVECGMCTKVCPVLNRDEKKHESHPYAAWCIDLEKRMLSASGGIFSALAVVILKKGGIVYGASTEGFNIVHKRITTESDLHLLQGSKYQHSSLVGVYRLIRKDLATGRYVLFSGLGCQVAGLLQFLGRTNTERLYTLDMICGGLSTMLPMLHLKESGEYKGICSFRDKENGWSSRGFKYSLKMWRKNGSVEDLGLNNVVLNMFSSKLLKRSSCLDCKFTGFNRRSDCTIGDFWGDLRFKEQHALGLSVFIAHGEHIMDLVREANMEIHPVSWKEIITNNHNLYWTHYPLIRYLGSRKVALDALRLKNYPKAMKQINSWSIPGLFLRIYLKINILHRKFSFYHTISAIDKSR